ncbi:MAG TPA: sigma-70 family RNA polymerase sigma factor [Lacipirellulaceae bacterium]
MTNDPELPAKLLVRLQRRDEAAFNEFVRAHQAAVYRLLLKILGDAADAEDVAQEVFVSAFKAIGDFRGESALGTWLHRIAYNHGLNRIKYRARRAREAQSPLNDAIAAQAGTGLGAAPVTPDQVVEGRQTEGLVQRALAMLDEEQRALISLRDLANMSYAEIGERTGLPIGTIKSKLHRARLALHQHFAKLREQP